MEYKKEKEMAKPVGLKCSYCKKYFVSADAFKYHLGAKHEIDMVPRRKFGNHQIPFNELIAVQELSQRGYIVSKQKAQIDKRFKIDSGQPEGENFKVGLASDIHLGSRFQQLTHLWSFYQKCAKEGVKVILVAGDITDGQSVYRGQQFELFCHGADAQADYAIKNYPRVDGVVSYIIGGNHDENHWRTAGVDVCRRIAQEREDIKYVGMYGAYVSVGGIEIYLHHGTGGVAYARSYKIQKFIEQMAPDQKPNILVEGNYHTSVFLPMYRNVVAIQLPCFQSQTPYLKTRGLYPEVAGVILEFSRDKKKNGIIWARPEWVFYFVPKKDDF